MYTWSLSTFTSAVLCLYHFPNPTSDFLWVYVTSGIDNVETQPLNDTEVVIQQALAAQPTPKRSNPPSSPAAPPAEANCLGRAVT